MVRRQCAVCNTRIQSNVVFRWKRARDGVIFHICGLCAEGSQGRTVNEDTVKIVQTKSYSTIA